MPTSPIQPSKPPSKRTTKQSVAPAPLPERPFLRFYHSELLRARTLAVLTTLEQARDSTQHRAALSALVLELTESGMEYYFLRPLQLANVGRLVEQSARMGLGGVKQLITPVIRNTIGRMDQQQLLTVCSYIRMLME